MILSLFSGRMTSAIELDGIVAVFTVSITILVEMCMTWRAKVYVVGYMLHMTSVQLRGLAVTDAAFQPS